MRRLTTTVLMTCLLCGGLGTSNARALDEPLPTPLVEVLDADHYAAASHALLDGVDRKALAASTEPDSGLAVIKIDPMSQAEQHGIAIGAVVTALDGHYIPNYRNFNSMRTSQPGTLTVWSQADGERTLPIVPGRVGIWFADRRWRSELTYLRGHGRADTLDNDMLVACLTHDDQVDLRETALAHVARAASDRPTPWSSLAAWVAFVRGHYQDAIGYAHLAVAADKDHSADTRLHDLIYQAAVASGRLRDAREALAQLVVSPSVRVSRGDLLAALDARIAGQTAQPITPPASALPPLATLRETLIEVGNRPEALDDVGARIAIAPLTASHSFPFQVPPDRYIACAFGPVGHDVSLSGVITYEPSATGSSRFAHSVRIGLGAQSDGNHRTTVCSVDINDNIPGLIAISTKGLPECLMQTAVPPGPTVANRFRITCIGSRLEIEINNTLVYQEVLTDDGTRALGCYFHMSGTKGAVTDVSWRINAAAAAKPPVPQTAAAPARPPVPLGKPGADDF